MMKGAYTLSDIDWQMVRLTKKHKTVSVKHLAKQTITPYPPEDIARLNAMVEPKAWDERQERWRRELILTFGFLRLSKAELTAAAENPDMIDALEAYCEAVRESRESLKAALHFLESADVRIMVGMAAAQFRGRYSA